jgi:hypothetical protein
LDEWLKKGRNVGMEALPAHLPVDGTMRRVLC